jgi:hypothetical protein
MARKPKTPADLPADAAGFIAIRPRNEHPALFNRDGALELTFAYGATDAEIAAILKPAGLRLDGTFVFHG